MPEIQRGAVISVCSSKGGFQWVGDNLARVGTAFCQGWGVVSDGVYCCEQENTWHIAHVGGTLLVGWSGRFVEMRIGK